MRLPRVERLDSPGLEQGLTLLVSRSGRNPDVYIPPILQPPQPISSYFLALDVLAAIDERRVIERRRTDFLRANPKYQAMCACGHHQLAHENGEGPCLARKCDCPRFRDVAEVG